MPFAVHQILISNEFGGLEEIALRLAVEVRKTTAARSEVWLPGEGKTWERAAAMKLSTNKVDAVGSLSKSWLRAGLSNGSFAFQLRKHPRGIAHIHTPFAYRALRHGLRWAGVRTVVHVHLEYGQEMLRWSLRNPPDAIITCATFLEQQVRNALPSHAQETQTIRAIPNSFDSNRFYPGDRQQAKRMLRTDPNCPVLLMLANLAPHKGQETTIRAVAELAKQGIKVQCWLAGAERSPGTNYEHSLRKLCQELDVIEHVNFLGFCTHTAELLRAADLLLLPSTCEGLPLTILEAQASGVPVLAAPTAGIPEVIQDGVTGCLIEATDHHAYANRIRHLLQDSQSYARIASKAREHCLQNHNWPQYWDRVRNVYDLVARECQSKPAIELPLH
jgi:glycosyltransferase involved in cell wall biosynthesis